MKIIKYIIKNNYKFICSTCKKIFYDINYAKNRKFCSRKCSRRIMLLAEKIMRSKIAKEKHYGLWMIGKKRAPFSANTIKKMSLFHQGKHHSIKTEFKAGELHPNWKGGKKEARRREWQRVKNNPRLKLRQNFSASICTKLKRRLMNKNSKSTFDFLPYTIEELITHLEKQFKNNITWENYGEWHIDHIKPDSSFDYKSVDDKEFQECWALSNLQPLWGKDNMSKGAKLNYIYPLGQIKIQ